MPFARSDRQSKTWGEIGPIFGVGRQAFLNGGSAPVPLLDEAGVNVLESFEDGTEVEIISWQPRGVGTRYCVRPTSGQKTGWVGVAQLRAGREQGAIKPGAVPSAWIAPRSPSDRERLPTGARDQKRRKGKFSDASR
jgi:hypothetical protein